MRHRLSRLVRARRRDSATGDVQALPRAEGPGASAWREPTPALQLLRPYDDEDDAVRIANDTIYGLAGGVWAADEERAKRVAARIRTGQVDINGGAFNPMAPFGGYKQSGHGRELGRYGLEEFLVAKSLQL